jgi:hypothetical protein
LRRACVDALRRVRVEPHIRLARRGILVRIGVTVAVDRDGLPFEIDKYEDPPPSPLLRRKRRRRQAKPKDGENKYGFSHRSSPPWREI